MTIRSPSGTPPGNFRIQPRSPSGSPPGNFRIQPRSPPDIPVSRLVQMGLQNNPNPILHSESGSLDSNQSFSSITPHSGSESFSSITPSSSSHSVQVIPQTNAQPDVNFFPFEVVHLNDLIPGTEYYIQYNGHFNFKNNANRVKGTFVGIDESMSPPNKYAVFTNLIVITRGIHLWHDWRVIDNNNNNNFVMAATIGSRDGFFDPTEWKFGISKQARFGQNQAIYELIHRNKTSMPPEIAYGEINSYLGGRKSRRAKRSKKSKKSKTKRRFKR
jgi:hypothetical protein